MISYSPYTIIMNLHDNWISGVRFSCLSRALPRARAILYAPSLRRLITAVENENYDYDGLRRGGREKLGPSLHSCITLCGGMAVSMAKLGKTEAFVSRRIAAKSIRSVEARRGPRDWSGGRTKRIKRCPSLFFTDVNRFTTRASLFLGNLSFPREPRESARAPGRGGLKFYFEKFVVRWMISVFDIWKGKVKKSSC